MMEPQEFAEKLLQINQPQRVCCRLVNTKSNRNLLDHIVHMPYLDLSIVFYWEIPLKRGLYAQKWIMERDLKNWGITKEELYQTALTNTVEQQRARLMTIQQALHEVTDQTSWDIVVEGMPQIYVLTNLQSRYGASVLLYPHILERCAAQLGCDFLVLPSSIHEVLLVPDFDSSPRHYDETAQLIQEVNQKDVLKEEVLSDHPYRYMRDQRKLISIPYTDSENIVPTA